MKRRVLLVLSLIFVTSSVISAQTAARKTITNADLEKYRQRRLQAEADYRENYAKRGMPSPEELERRNEEDRRWREEFARRAEAEQQASGDYWGARAGELRNEIVSVDAQIRYVRGLINSVPERRLYSGGVVVGGYGAGVYRGGGRGGRGRVSVAPTVVGPNVGNVILNSPGSPSAVSIARSQQTGIYGGFRGGVRYGNRGNGGVFLGGTTGGVRRWRGGGYPYYGGYGAGYVADYSNYSRDDLILRLQSLEQERAGLGAQWNLLVEEARRAGVRIN